MSQFIANQTLLASPGPRIEIPKPLRFFVEKQARYKGAYGGRGSVKSWTIARILLGLGRHKKLLILCAREYQKSIRDSVHRLLKEQIYLLGLLNEYDVRETTIVHRKTHTEFIFTGLMHMTSLKSLEGVDICWIEEAESVSESSWKILDPTIRKPGSEIWVSFNPMNEDDPTYLRFVTKPLPDTISVCVSWKDNYWLPEVLRRQAENMRENDPEAYAHIWEGKTWFRNDAQVLNGKWGVKDFNVEQIENREGPFFGADWGFSQDPTALVKSYIEILNPEDFGKTFVAPDGIEAYLPLRRNLYIAEEAFAIGCEIRDLPDLFDQVSESRLHTIKADNARPETISHMQSEGFMVEACEKWPGCVEDGVTYLRGFERIFIHPSCKNMFEEARLWSFKTDRVSEKIQRQLKLGHDHGWDGVRYSHEGKITRTATMFD